MELGAPNGIMLAGPGEFSLRAFLNGKIDLVQAEAIAAFMQQGVAVRVVFRDAGHIIGAAIIEHLNDAGIACPVERIGWPDEFIDLSQAIA